MSSREIELLTKQLHERLFGGRYSNFDQTDRTMRYYQLQELNSYISELRKYLTEYSTPYPPDPIAVQKLHYCNEFFRRVGISCDCSYLSVSGLESYLKKIYKKYK